VFKNVRFGARPPRFQAPRYPITLNSSLQDSNYGFMCHQIDTSTLKNPPGGRRPALLAPHEGAPDQSEDCLFLDIYVPAAAFDANGNPRVRLPVTVWFYGGAYAFGSKELSPDIPLYTGQSMLEASGYQHMFVAGNYRLGAFGWLAGSYMEKVGQPNAGLYDQALLLDWVQKYISQAAGDPTKVSAWGESAGGGSILHHLVREGGTVNPKFSSFLVESPAFEWSWDNRTGGTLDAVYRNFSHFAGCGPNFNFRCLTTLPEEDLANANQALFDSVKQTGMFPVGPSVDGRWIQTIPTISFASGKYWKGGINGAIISHVANETASFTPPYVVDKATFTTFLHTFFPEPSLQPIRDSIAANYNCTSSPYNGDYHACAADVIRDSSFTCNTRNLFDAFPSIAHMMLYGFPEYAYAYHAADLVPTFANGALQAYHILVYDNVTWENATAYAALLDAEILSWYQGYFSSFAVYGDPNTGRVSGSKVWPVATNGAQLSNVMEIAFENSTFSWFNLISDGMNQKSVCNYWLGLAAQIMRLSSPKKPHEYEGKEDL